MAYCQFQTISSFSFGKSSIKCREYVERGERLGYDHLAIADVNSVASFPYLYNASKESNVRPIYGMMVTILEGEDKFEGELVVLNERGYLNLMRIVNLHRETYSLEDFEDSSGLAFILKTQEDHYKEEGFLNSKNNYFFKFSKIFEKFYFGIEIYSKTDMKNVEVLRRFISEHSYQSMAFPKVIYLDPEQGYQAYLILKCIVDKTLIEDQFEEKHSFFLLSQNALKKIYKLDELEATEKLAQTIDFEFMKKRGEVLKCELEDSASTLREEVLKGISKRLNGQVPQEYLERIDYELKIINQMNFNDYFLIVSDYVNFAKSSGIKVGPGRGSAAGSLVSYALNITDIDPIEYGLFFERFLNPLRVTMPDIDIDFQDDRRMDVINYLKNKYGASRVALIVTYSTLKVRSAIRHVGSVYNIPEKRLSKITGCLSFNAKDFVTEKARNYRFVKLLKDEYYRKIVQKAELVLNYPVNISTHASGVILSNTDLRTNVPIFPGEINVVGFEQSILEEMGYLKMDILALNYLTLLSNIEKKIKENNKVLPRIDKHLNDRKTFELLNKGYLVNIPQIESYGMQQTIKSIKPTSISEISSVLALYRPGPKVNIPVYADRKNKHIPYKLVSPKLASILKDTYGIIIYQEQILQIAKQIAGFDGGKADLLRRAIAKKKVKQMDELKKDFIAGAVDNGLAFDEANSIFMLIYEFANYGFNKSHSLAYSFITYTALYYKANFPQEFYQACLEKISLSDKQFFKLATEMRFFSYRVINPSINESENTYSFSNGNYRVGFSQIKGISYKIGEQIIAEREKNGEFTSLGNFIMRIPESSISESELRILIDAGALDEFGYSRKAMNDKLEELSLARSFATREEDLPLMEKSDNSIDVSTFVKEYNALGAVLSTSLQKLIEGQSNFFSLYVLVDQPREYNGRYIANGINNFQSRTLFLPLGEPLEKYDVVSVEEERKINYSNPTITKYKKEKLAK
ncbi:MAG: DNA polymerase III subunit alpha [Bacilli bacterium]